MTKLDRLRYHHLVAQTHPFQTDDARLQPIADKVLAGQRLNAADALTLYASPDVLAVGWLANHVRERRHGNNTYFNVNRHINPTNVCVAACRLCAFWPQEGHCRRLHHGSGRSLADRRFRIQ